MKGANTGHIVLGGNEHESEPDQLLISVRFIL